MSKKETKKGTSKATDKGKGATKTEDREPWINELKSFTINDENWSCNVSLLIEQNAHALSYVAAFNSVFINKENIRPCIKVLSENVLAIDMIEKNYNSDIHKLSISYKKLSEEALKYYSSEGFSNEIPIPILASLIKYYIYNLRLQYLAEKQAIETYEKKSQKLRDDSRLGIENIMKRVPASKDKENKTTGKTTKTPSSKKSSAKEVQVSKLTNLRKRGEEVLDYYNIPSDAPSDGPQTYIILNSFLRVDLPLELLKLGIPLVAIVKLYDFCTPDENSLIDKLENIKICEGLDTVTKETTIKQRKFSDEMIDFLIKQSSIDSFWGNFFHILNDHKNVSLFKDTIFMKFYPKQTTSYEELNEGKQSEDVLKMIRKSIYTQICHLQYDIQDVKRQHQNFVDNLVDRDVVGKRFHDFKEMNLYTSTVESVPPEVINIPFILHCILIQVEYFVDHVVEMAENEGITGSIVNETDTNEDEYLKFEKFLEELDDKHDLFKKEEIYEKESTILPTVLIHGNESGIKSHWCSNTEYVQAITNNILQSFWEQILSRHLPVFDEVISLDELRDTSLFTMLKQHKDVTLRDRLCNMPCAYTDNSFIVENKVRAYCLDDVVSNDEDSEKSQSVNFRCTDPDPNKYKHFEDPNESHFVGNIYDMHSYCFEEMTSDIMLQNMFQCLENYNCIDVSQDYFKGRLFVKFHHKNTCHKSEYLLGTLKTKTSLRDFYDYIIEEEFYWLQNQELLYDKINCKKEIRRLATALNKLEYLKNKMDCLTSKVCEESNFLVQHSLKLKGHETLELPIISSYIEDELKFSDLLFLPDINGESFDIDVPYRVQFSEKQEEFIISERSKVNIKKLIRLYKDEAVAIQTTINDHTLYFYQPITSEIRSEVHLIHKSGILFHIKKNTVDDGIAGPLKMPRDVNNDDSNEYLEPFDVFLKPLLYELCLTLPNTLCLEFINPLCSSLYVKQYYLTNNFMPSEIQNEKSRCFLTDGKILKFMEDDMVVIYCHNGDIFKCEVSTSIEVEKKASTPETKINTSKRDVRVNKEKQKIPNKLNQEIVDKTTLRQPLPAQIGVPIKSYEHTLSTGERLMVYDNKKSELEPLFLRTFSDIFNGLLISERADGTTLTFNAEGTLFVDFPDGSRITTKASFDVNEISFATDDELDEVVDFNVDEANCMHMNTSNLQKNIQSQASLSEISEEYLEEESYINYIHTRRKSERFVLINLQYLYEHVNYASVSTDLNKEEINTNLPQNVNLTLSSEGLYNITLDKHSEFITDYNKFIFREINGNTIPEFNIYLSGKDNNNVENDTTNQNIKQDINSNKYSVDEKLVNTFFINEDKRSMEFIIFSCEDGAGNKLTVNNKGDVVINVSDYKETICKCSKIKNGRVFVFNEEYNGFEIFSPNRMDSIEKKSKKVKGCVAQYYGTLDHNVLLLLTPLEQNEREKWLKPLCKITRCPLYTWPSTYNDEHTTYNPFPKIKPQPEPLTIPNVILIRVINRINCNVHVLEKTFLRNKETPDSLRLNKNPVLALELYKRKDIPFCKADKVFIEYIKNSVIGSLIARVRSRVIHRLEIRKIKEYTEILMKRLLLPYFDSGQGATFVILMDLILATVQLCSTETHKLEKLFYKPLKQLRDDDLDFMHDRIAPLTVNRFCNCDENGAYCQLKILLLAGKTLHGIFPDMITVFFSYGSTLKKKKEHERFQLEWQKLLSKPTDTLTEDDVVILHNKLKSMPNCSFCTCGTNDKRQCKLVAILVASVTLSFLIPDVNSVLRVFKIEIKT